MNKYYMRSYRAEREAYKILVSEGYSVVRASSSKGVCDLIGIGTVFIKLVEVKYHNDGVRINYRKEAEPLRKLYCPANCIKEIWYRADGKTFDRRRVVTPPVIARQKIKVKVK